MGTPIPSMSLLRLLLFASILFLERAFAFEERLNSEIHHRQSTHHNLHINSLMPSTNCKPSPKGVHVQGHDKRRASLEVVHKHGPCSKLKQHKTNPPSHVQILTQDESRVASIQSMLASKNTAGTMAATLPTKLRGRILGSGNYVVRVGLGSPKKDITLAFDTASDLSWTQCQPCLRSFYCYNQEGPVFDPRTSLSYANISCSSPLCQNLAAATGNDPRCDTSTSTCVYGFIHGDASFSFGFFAKDKLTLTPSDVFDDFQFGCGIANGGLFGGASGFLGLGRNPLSLISQTAQKYGKVFSYCLPSSADSTGYLTFGSGERGDSSREVKYTSSKINTDYPSFYFLGMEGISVGGQKLPIPESVFSTAGTVLDSGTAITRLPPEAYVNLQKAFMELMSDYPTTNGVSILDTCYNLTGYKAVEVPKIVLYFSDGVEMDLPLQGTLYQVKPWQICLAFAGNMEVSDVGVIGYVQQKTFHVVYDDAIGRVGFAPKGCE